MATERGTTNATVVNAAAGKSEGAYFPGRDLFTTPPPGISSSEAESLLLKRYQIRATVRRLDSERDANFLVIAEDAKYILKITNNAEPRARTALNSAVLEHLAVHAPELPVPKLVRTVDGDFETFVSCGEKSGNIIRLLTFLDGRPLGAIPNESRPLAGIGACLGQLDKTLESFRPPDTDFSMVWDSANVDTLADLSACIPAGSCRLLIENHLENFQKSLKSKLTALRRQVIHNDANLNNILVSPDDPAEISGLIDFGDIVVAPAVNELAVACSYHLSGACDVAAVLTSISSGYHDVYPLREEELEVLPGLIIARFVTTILVTHWRASLFPKNHAYILRNNPSAWSGLRLLSEHDHDDLVQSLRAACGMAK